MNFAVVFAAVLAVAAAQVPGFGQTYYPSSTIPPPRPVAVSRTNEQAAVIVRFENEINPDNTFKYSYETDNGIAAEAQGNLEVTGGDGNNPPDVSLTHTGSFGWTSPEGVPVAISYIANAYGYQPQGDAIPTPPPTPEAILRSLEYIARNAPVPQKK